MRQILFKAKRIDNGEWEIGSLINKGGSSYIFTYDYENHDELIGCPREEFLNFWKVDPETVCQFTGLTDKNGVKIFEGSDVKYTTKIRGKVVEIKTKVVWKNNMFTILDNRSKWMDFAVLRECEVYDPETCTSEK